MEAHDRWQIVTRRNGTPQTRRGESQSAVGNGGNGASNATPPAPSGSAGGRRGDGSRADVPAGGLNRERTSEYRGYGRVAEQRRARAESEGEGMGEGCALAQPTPEREGVGSAERGEVGKKGGMPFATPLCG